MRLFVGIDLAAGQREALSRCYAGLHGARWVPVENLHLTLRFVGEIPNPVADEVDLSLAGLRARRFRLGLGGAGVSERNGRPTTLWVGIEPREPALDHLRTKIDNALRRAGLPTERRRFSPHVSIARVDQVAPHQLAAWVQSHNLLRIEPSPVERFTLFSSAPGKEQAFYTPEVDYALD